MAQMTWRADAELLERVRRAAEEQGRSLNDYVTRVLEAATDPELAGSEAERVRARLRSAGLLAPVGHLPSAGPASRPDAGAVAAARRAAGRGRPASDLVAEGRG